MATLELRFGAAVTKTIVIKGPLIVEVDKAKWNFFFWAAPTLPGWHKADGHPNVFVHDAPPNGTHVITLNARQKLEGRGVDGTITVTVNSAG